MWCLFVPYLHNWIQNADSVLQPKRNIPVFIFRLRESRERERERKRDSILWEIKLSNETRGRKYSFDVINLHWNALKFNALFSVYLIWINFRARSKYFIHVLLLSFKLHFYCTTWTFVSEIITDLRIEVPRQSKV